MAARFVLPALPGRMQGRDRPRGMWCRVREAARNTGELGSLLLYSGQVEQAIEALRSALETTPLT